MKLYKRRALREKEQSFTESAINKEALEEEKKQATAIQNEILEERRKLQEEVKLGAHGAFNNISISFLLSLHVQDTFKISLV